MRYDCIACIFVCNSLLYCRLQVSGRWVFHLPLVLAVVGRTSRTNTFIMDFNLCQFCRIFSFLFQFDSSPSLFLFIASSPGDAIYYFSLLRCSVAYLKSAVLFLSSTVFSTIIKDLSINYQWNNLLKCSNCFGTNFISIHDIPQTSCRSLYGQQSQWANSIRTNGAAAWPYLVSHNQPIIIEVGFEFGCAYDLFLINNAHATAVPAWR